MREILKPKIAWQVGRGDKCKAFAEPWHDFWQTFQPQNLAQQRLTLHDLLDAEGLNWSHDALVTYFGTGVALHILSKYPRPQINTSTREDRLIFTPAKSGQLTFKEACKLLQAPHPHTNQQMQDVLKVVWHCPGILPRIRLFLWKTIVKGVPLRGTFADRLGLLPPDCSVCGQGIEEAKHTLFDCSFAKGYWFSSPLAMRVDSLPHDMISLLYSICQALQAVQFVQFANLLWALWKSRCSHIMEGKKLETKKIYQLANYHNNLSRLVSSMQIPGSLKHIWARNEEGRGDGVECFTDGSLGENLSAGWAYVLWSQGELLHYAAECGSGTSALSVEISAMQLAVKSVGDRGVMMKCTFYTDSHQLQQIVEGRMSLETVPWECYHEALILVQTMRAFPNFQCRHIPRDKNQEAHCLANYARISFVSCSGYTFPSCPFNS
ncbi:hypothetical protein LUZ62_027870 [Rhynchospora pubera]|uniref:Reverse transcriptase zinc-binding domain-containing protein n=1 Tax=Rhynchospora pubera TaxID=906938 RepID=A0AAV8HF39_9POAL|nr:hypothetical protein LUZ62_027870 [Rhynchospora pubera]